MAVVIFKAVEKCNSNCIYCDVIKKKQNKVMDVELLRLIFRRMDEYLRENPEKNITFTWHGGEVCLLGPEYFITAHQIQEELCPTTRNRINHQVQSNLTLINQEILDAFRNLGITQVGSSYDPIPGIRGFGRNRDSEAYNRKFMKGVKLLDKNKMLWGVIYVVHKKSLERPLDLFYFLTNLNAESHPNFNPIKLFGEDIHGLNITGEEFAHFLGTLFPVWWENRNRYPNVQPFAQLTKNIIHQDMSLMCENSGACQYDWIYIGPEGNTSQCGRGGDYNILTYGNLNEYSFGEIMRHEQRDQLEKRQIFLAENDCKDCRLWGICHGGCPLDAFMTFRDFNRRSPVCDAMKVFIEQYFEPITGHRAEFPPAKNPVYTV